MTNFEKYREEIKAAYRDCTLGGFFNTHIYGRDDNLEDGFRQGSLSTYDVMRLFAWLNDEYKEQEVDWSKVPVDTPILVSKDGHKPWFKRYFAKFENGKVYAWYNGKTSWTSVDSQDLIKWDYAKLAEREEKC